MPSKNAIKIYIEDGIYHIYNRGVEKRDIFCDEQDYKIFLYYLKSYLTDIDKQDKPPYGISRYSSDFTLHKEIRLLCYCLMPNHFHLMMQQLTISAMPDFMKRLSNAYVKYFNDKYLRDGGLFQGCYKAALVKKESHFLHLPYYIHIHNPYELYQKTIKDEEIIMQKIRDYPWSSYLDYLGERKSDWVYTEGLMQQFQETTGMKVGIEECREILGPIVAID